MNHRIRVFARLLAVVGIALATPNSVSAAGPIVLDGLFDDWAGQMHLDDPPGDAKNEKTDMSAFYFGTNPDDSNLYFMAGRWGGGAQPLRLRLKIDTDNNRVFTEPQDRILDIRYQPSKEASQVDVEMLDGNGLFLAPVIYSADWGDSANEGGLRVEWGIAFAQLGISPQQAIRMVLESADGNDFSDQIPNSGDIQWSPASALGIPLLAVLLIAGIGWLVYQRRRPPWRSRS